LDDLRELGLSPEYLRYVDYWPGRPSDDPLANPEWRAEFLSRTDYGRIAMFYAGHPWRALVIIYRALKNRASRRQLNLGNYERRYGFPPGAQTKSFCLWWGVRLALSRAAPWHIAVWYAGFLGIAIRLVFRRGTVPPRLPLFAVLLPAMGLVELAGSSLADTGETDRHLFLFHVITDFTIVLAIVWAAWLFQGKASLRVSS
jgi:hypothetical protein